MAATLPPEQPRHLIGLGAAARPHPQPRRGVLDRHRLHLDPHPRRLRRRRRDPCGQPPPRQPRRGRWPSACCSAARWATWPTGCCARPAPAAGTSSTSSSCPHWPIFNLADSAIVSAAVLIALLALRGIGFDGARAAEREPKHSTERSAATMADVRALPVPDGLEGERVDAALARLFGLSRTKAADLAADRRGAARRREVGKSDRVRGRRVARGDAARAARPRRRRLVAEPVPGMAVVHDDDDIVVVDKPVGVAAHPSPGLDRPDRGRRPGRGRLPDLHLGRRRAPGHRAPPRRRHQRADGGGQERARLHRAQARLQGAHGRQDLPRAGAGPSRPGRGTIDAPDRPAPHARLQVRRGRRRQAAASPTTR